MTFALTSFVMLATVGGAIDLGRSISLRDMLQQSTDNAALASGSPNETTLVATAADSGMAANLLAEAKTSTEKRALELGGKNVVITGSWLNDYQYQVLGEIKLKTNFLSVVPGFADEHTVRTLSVVQTSRIKVVASAPTKKDVSYEAADYNQVWVYCYNRNWATEGTRTSDEGTSTWNTSGSWNTGGNLTFVKDMASKMNTKGRSDFTLISDNGASTFPFSMPACKEGETISYALFNSRNNRTSPGNWKNSYSSCGTSLQQTGKSCYQWFTDTQLDSNEAEQHQGTSPYQLESVLCNDANCTSLTDGGYIPSNNQTKRIPQKVSKKCESGKFMYLGWEDRPPYNSGTTAATYGQGPPKPAGQNDGGGDRDYDDIRLIVSCPTYAKDSVLVRLVK